MKFLILMAPVLAMSSMAWALTNGSDIAECKGVTDVCMAANVKDAKTGKSGYEPGEWKDGDGLWKNCVGPLAKGQPVAGLASTPPAAAAKTCLQAYHAKYPEKHAAKSK